MSTEQTESKRNILFFLIPLAIFLVLVVFLLLGLYSDPRERVSVQVEKQLPEFSLNDLMEDGKTWQREDLLGEVFLLNVWGTWCITCDQELPYLTELRQKGVKIVGLYYDQDIDPDFGESMNLSELRADVRRKLMRLGDPYQFNILDDTREMLLDLGVTGAPETFLVDRNGVIKVHHLGDINPRVWRAKFAALYNELQSQQSQQSQAQGE